MTNLNKLNTMTKEEYINTINGFKKYIKSQRNIKKENRTLGLRQFVFYALLRNKDYQKVTHDIESKKFKEVISSFDRKYIKISGFENLNDDQIKEILSRI